MYHIKYKKQDNYDRYIPKANFKGNCVTPKVKFITFSNPADTEDIEWEQL